MTWAAQEKSRILAEYPSNKSVTLTQCWVCTGMNREPPARNTIIRWERNFQNRRSIALLARSGRPRSSEQESHKHSTYSNKHLH